MRRLPLLSVLSLLPAAGALLGAGAGLAKSTSAEPPAPVEIREWKVPWPDTRPRDPFAVSENEVWFVGQVGSYLARLDAAKGAFARLDLPDRAAPHNLVVDEEGVVWYAGNANGTIGRYDPDAAGGEGLAPASTIERIPLPPEAPDPHTLLLGPGGALWFTVQGGNFVGRLDRATREVRLAKVPAPNARPYGIALSPQGVPWVALFGTNALARVDPQTLEIAVHRLPRADAHPRRLDVGSDGRVWYVDYPGGRLGVYDPQRERFTEWLLPSGADARPYAMAVDHRDRVWLVETGAQPNRLVGFDPKGGAEGEGAFLGAVELPSGGLTVRHMHFHAPSRTLWFGTDAHTIGRATLDPAERGGAGAELPGAH